MRCAHIRDDDNLYRHCIHPVSFRGRTFASEKLIKIYDKPDGSLLASLAWERLVPTTELLHASGCRLALGMNENLLAKGKFKEEERRIYCGAYQLRAAAVRSLSAVEELNEIVSADVVHRVEKGEIAHTDLRIVLTQEVDFDIENTKTAIVDRLWSFCCGPLKHKCECEKDNEAHPSSDLIEGPRGAYSDTRPYMFRLWSIITYRIFNCMWHKFCRRGN